MANKVLFFTIILLPFFLSSHIYALNPDKILTQYNIQVWDNKNGLPSNSVYAVTQTRDGYLWIGTQNGLVRFDGVRFRLYNRSRDSRLESDVVRALYQDREGTLWIGTDSGGLTSFKDGEFFTYPVSKYKALDKIRTINGGRRGDLWIGSSIAGLTRFANGRFTTYTTKEGLPHNQVRSIYKDTNKNLWVTTSGGVVKVNKNGIFTIFAPRSLLPVLKTGSVFDSGTNELWIGTWGKGLFRLKHRIVTRFGKQQGFPDLNVTCLFEDRGGNLWAGSEGGTLSRIKNNGSRFDSLSISSPLAEGSVNSIYEDKEGSLWIGTLDEGLIHLRDNKFTVYTTSEGLSHNYASCVSRDRDGGILVGTKEGLSRMASLKENRFRPLLPAGKKLLNKAVSCLFEDSSGTLWIGTWGGLHKFKDNVLTSITKEDGLTDNRVKHIALDALGNTWVGTEKGLNRIDGETGAITTFTTKEGLSGDSIEFLFQDRAGTLCIGSGAALNYLENDRIVVYNPPVHMAVNLFLCGHRDKNRVLWLGTDRGMLRVEDEKTTLFNEKTGLHENHIYSILEDDFGYIWLAGRNGISRIAKKELETVASGTSKRVYPEAFDENDGLKSRWCTGPGFKAPDGKLWFPTSLGAALIDPERIEKKSLLKPKIEKLVADGETFCMYKNTPGKRKLVLGPGKKRLELYYTGFSFIDAHKLRFKIKLAGFDNDWVEMGNLRSTTYTGLGPGDYTFTVRVGKPGGDTKNNEVSFDFYVKPYFFQTIWFYLAVSFLILLFIYSLHFVKVRRLRARKEELKELVRVRTADLEERNVQLQNAHETIRHSNEEIEEKNRQLENQTEQLKELDKAKSSFFANISHEFRTPLTLIKGPLEQILAENPDKVLETRANIMLRNSRGLLNLVDQLLELARFDSGKMELKTVRRNIVSFMRSVVMCFESLARQNKINLDFKTEADEIILYFDPEKLERIIFNLLSNAFNYTPPGGGISVYLREIPEPALPSGCLEIVVKDTGSGIAAERLPRIFDRFYRGETSHDYRRKGTGIGLALTKELVELHRGQIEVESKCLPGHRGGTAFFIRLPRGKDHLNTREIEAPPGKYNREIAPMLDYSGLARTETGDGEHTGDSEGNVSPGHGGDEYPEKKPIILVVDDNPDVRSYIKSALANYFIVKEAADGKEGIQKAGDIIPDLVISDVMMPIIDGFELCAHLKKDIKTSHIPVILLTARASETSMAQGLETGADDYVTKPFNADLLIIRVKNLIRLRRQLQCKIQQDLMLSPGEVSVSSIDNEFLKEVRVIIETNMSDPAFNVKQMAEKLFMSPATLRRKIEALTGDTTTRLIRYYRLSRAAQLLKDNFGNITEIAFAVGFNNTAYFAKCFKERFNKAPHAFQTAKDQ